MQYNSRFGPPRAHLTDNAFVWGVFWAALLVRLMIVIAMQLSDAMHTLRLSPDSERYHREGIGIARDMSFGNFSTKPWIDDGWFQFTGLIYHLFGPYDWLMQLINITLSAAIVFPLFAMICKIVDERPIQRLYLVAVAFFPSIVYWSVLMLKDPASLLATVLVVYALFHMRISPKWHHYALYVLGLCILTGTRTYLAVVLVILSAPALLLFPYRAQRHLGRAVVAAIALGLVPLALGFGYYGISYALESIYFDLDYLNHVRVAMGDHGTGALFETADVHVWGESIVGDMFAILITLLAVFIPVNPFDVNSFRQFLALPLALVMIVLMVPMVRGLRYAWRIRQLSAPIIIVAAGVLATYISATTNAGALFRWTTQIMPFFLMAIVIGAFCRPGTVSFRFARRMASSWA